MPVRSSRALDTVHTAIEDEDRLQVGSGYGPPRRQGEVRAAKVGDYRETLAVISLAGEPLQPLRVAPFRFCTLASEIGRRVPTIQRFPLDHGKREVHGPAIL